MANRFEKLNKLRNKLIESSHDFRASTEIFPNLNVERIASDLGLEETGVSRGAEDRPPAAAKTLDDIELAIVERVEEEKKSAHHVLEDNLQLFSDRLTSLDFEEQFGLIRQANAASVSDFKGEVTLGLDELHGLRRALNTAETEHSWFREKHGLVRAARLPEGGVFYFKCTFILFLLFLETALNGTFLAKGSEQGLLGGIVEAFSFSVVNIGVALLLAIFGVRLVTHRLFFAKLVGVAAIIVYIVVAFAINFALAHFREIAGSDQFTLIAGQETVARLRNDLLGLRDIQSWLLLAIGIIFSIAAFIDGWFMFDPYTFNSGSAELTEDFKEKLRKRAPEIAAIARQYKVDVIEIIGHTDEQAMSGMSSNMDRGLKDVLDHREPITHLRPADNAGLGLARALSVAGLLKQMPDLAGITILPLSGGQMVLPGDIVTDGARLGDVRERRRIEIRVRKRVEPSPTKVLDDPPSMDTLSKGSRLLVPVAN